MKIVSDRDTFHIQVRQRTLLMLGDCPEHFHGLSPMNRWPIRVDKSVSGTIPTFLDQPQTEQLDNVPTGGRIRA